MMIPLALVASEMTFCFETAPAPFGRKHITAAIRWAAGD
jgi:hypothetical protein